MIKDYFKIAIKNLRKRQLRSWLTLVGIFMSIAIIFILVSLSLGLQGAVGEQFKKLGSDKFFVQPLGMSGGPGSSGAVTLTTKDAEIIEKVSGVEEVTYMAAGNSKVEYGDKTRYYPVYGIPEGGMDLFIESGSIEIDEGRLIQKDGNKEVMLGSDFKKGKLFDKPLKTGSTILIDGVEFKVKTIFEPVGNPQDDKNIIIGFEDFKSLFSSGEKVDYIIIKIKEGENITEVADRVERKLMNFRDVTEKTKDFAILTPEELLKSFQTILNIITYFLIGVAAISLVVGSIGIANTMYTSVLERTREIGVMKAIGARNSDILLIFLIESGLIGATGGILGVILGLIVAKSVEFVAANQLGTNLLQAATPLYLILGCIGFAFIIGALSGIFPARQASKTKTVDALRYE
ncbi:ABC transporter permease [Candidatus Pacearchaeota archaeon]|nr:ABC transporter permease [Candidatus Pacearchaeota archaeon]